MYKSGGENVFAAEVESVLAEHPKLAEVAIIGFLTRNGERSVGRWWSPSLGPRSSWQTSSSTAPEARQVQDPQERVVVDALPRNVLGKVQKPQLRAIVGGTGGTTTPHLS